MIVQGLIAVLHALYAGQKPRDVPSTRLPNWRGWGWTSICRRNAPTGCAPWSTHSRKGRRGRCVSRPCLLAQMIGLLLVIGAFAGVVAGLLGVGGGIVLVPAFFYLFSALGYGSAQLMQVCLATSLATIIVTSARSVQSHNRKGRGGLGHPARLGGLDRRGRGAGGAGRVRPAVGRVAGHFRGAGRVHRPLFRLRPQ